MIERQHHFTSSRIEAIIGTAKQSPVTGQASQNAQNTNLETALFNPVVAFAPGENVTRAVFSWENDMAMVEIWFPIEGYPDYSVSDRLRIRGMSGRILNPCKGKVGYPTVSLRRGRNEKPCTVYVHRLVAIARIPNPDNKRCVNHKDGDKLNYKQLENLEWVTYQENMQHAHETGLMDNLKQHHENKRARTECIHGHPLDGWKTSKGGFRYCKTCSREDCRRRRAVKKAAALIMAIAIMLIPSHIKADDKPKEEATATPVLLPGTHGMAVELAAKDLSSLDPSSRPFQFYVWVRDKDVRKIQTCNFVMNNTVSEFTNPVVVQPVIINRELLRYDTRQLAPRGHSRLHRLLDQLIDPQFYLVGTETIAALNLQIEGDGSVTAKIEARPQVVFGSSVAANYAAATSLQAMTGRAVPICRYDFLLKTVSSTTDGGLYYNFVGIKGTPNDEAPTSTPAKPSRTPLDTWLKRVVGVTLDEVQNQFESDQKAVQLISGITFKHRSVAIFGGHSIKPGVNQNLAALTFDQADGTADPRNSPVRNIDAHDFAGGEGLIERPNGGLAFIIYNSSGQILNSVPDNIAADHSAPKNAGTSRLEPGVSCYRCHSMKENEADPAPGGWKHMARDLRFLLRNGVDVTGSPADIARIAGRYETDLAKPIRRAREDLSDFVVRATGIDTTTDEAFAAAASDYDRFWHDPVDAEKACREIGIDPGDNAQQALSESLLPRMQQLAFQDPMIVALMLDMPIRRLQFEVIFQDLMHLRATPEEIEAMVKARQPLPKPEPPKAEPAKVAPKPQPTTSGRRRTR